KDDCKAIAYGRRFASYSFLGHHWRVRLDTVSLPAIDGDSSPPGRRITRDYFGSDQLEDGSLAVIERMAHTIDFMFDVAQSLVGGAQRSILHLKIGVFAFHLLQRLQTSAHGSNLFLQPRAAAQKWCQQLIDAGLELACALWPKAETCTQTGGDNQP